MVQVVRREDVKRLERARPNTNPKDTLSRFVPMAEEPPRSLREILKAALDKGKAAVKAMEKPETALSRAAAEPIAEEIILASCRGAFKLH